MNNDDIKNIALSICKLESVDKIIEVLEKDKLYSNDSAWRNFGDNENNFGTIGNQQEFPEGALVEKLINSVDSVLTNKCLIKNIDPESNDAPEDILKAVEKFFQIPNGKLSNITPSERGLLAEKSIGVICTGNLPKEGNPNYTVFDSGEGQIPSRISKTFMSINKSNKIRIPFVQGKFNMGGTGVFRFCNTSISQLLITKRNPEILKEDDPNDKNKWGFTIVKKIRPTGNMKSSSYVYLVDPNTNEPFSFLADSIPILPGDYPEKNGKSMKYGSFIKLYNYDLPGYKTNITLDLYNRLSLLMTSVALPIRLYERRKNYQANTYETTLNGMSVRLEEDRSKNLESDEWPSTEKMIINGQEFQIKIYAFKNSIKGGRRKNPTQNYVKTEGIIFTVNGQYHGAINRSFFNKKSIGLGILSKHIIVTVDASKISREMTEDIFMNSRDRLQKSGDIIKKIETNLERILSDHQGLKSLKNKRYEEQVKERLDDSKPLQEVVQNILSSSPSLSKIFISGEKLKNPFGIGKGGIDSKYEGKKFPSFFTLTKKYEIDAPRKFPINQNSIRIELRTDVVNDYFEREVSKGEHNLYLNGDIYEGDSSIGLWNGTATLNIYYHESLNFNELLKFKSKINDDSRIEPLANDIYIQLSEEKNKSRGKNGERKPPIKKEDGDQKTIDGINLPDITEVERGDDNWETYEFTEFTSLHSVYNGEEIGYSFYLNMHNVYLLNQIKENLQNTDPKIIKAQYKYANTLIAMSVIHLVKEKKIEINEEVGEDDLIKNATSCVSMIIIPMISYLGDLKG